jgi:hypothetical protein
MKDTLSQNSHDRFMNFIANDDWRPNGGFYNVYLRNRSPTSSAQL